MYRNQPVSINASILHKNQERCTCKSPWMFQLISFSILLKTSRVYCSKRRDHNGSFQSQHILHGCTFKFTSNSYFLLSTPCKASNITYYYMYMYIGKSIDPHHVVCLWYDGHSYFHLYAHVCFGPMFTSSASQWVHLQYQPLSCSHFYFLF